MLRKSCIAILVAISLMAVSSPMLQVDSLDSFPVCSDDIELLVTLCLCIAGMVFVFAEVMKVFPLLKQVFVHLQQNVSALLTVRSAPEQAASCVLFDCPVPLRI